jgi:hypothetical protein
LLAGEGGKIFQYRSAPAAIFARFRLKQDKPNAPGCPHKRFDLAAAGILG